MQSEKFNGHRDGRHTLSECNTSPCEQGELKTVTYPIRSNIFMIDIQIKRRLDRHRQTVHKFLLHV